MEWGSNLSVGAVVDACHKEADVFLRVSLVGHGVVGGISSCGCRDKEMMMAEEGN